MESNCDTGENSAECARFTGHPGEGGGKEGKGKKVHDSPLSSTPEQLDGRGRGNETTYWHQIQECYLVGVMGQMIKRVLGLRDKFGIGRRVLIQKMDVKSIFRQMAVDPAGAAKVGYVMEGYVFIDVSTQFR